MKEEARGVKDDEAAASEVVYHNRIRLTAPSRGRLPLALIGYLMWECFTDFENNRRIRFMILDDGT